jgi:hypothetical protein
MLRFCCDQYTVHASMGAPPLMYPDFAEHAILSEDFRGRADDGTSLFFAVDSGQSDWPELVVALRFAGPEGGFEPGFLLIPERRLLLVGAGTCLLAYELMPVRRLWEDVADEGFWRWRRHGDIVLMQAELEFAAWDINGQKLWSTFVEPPWSYEIHGDQVALDVMGKRSRFAIATGPPPESS